MLHLTLVGPQVVEDPFRGRLLQVITLLVVRQLVEIMLHDLGRDRGSASSCRRSFSYGEFSLEFAESVFELVDD